MTITRFNMVAYAIISVAFVALASSWQWLGGIDISGYPALNPIVSLPLAVAAAGVSIWQAKR